MKKRLLPILLACVLMLGMVGTAISAGAEDLTLWTWKIAMTPGFQAAADAFAEKTGHTITIEAFSPDDTYRQKVIAAANSGDLPDLIHWWATRGVGFENVLVNFTDIADEDFRAGFGTTAFDSSLVREIDVKNWAADAEKSDVVKALGVGDLYQIPLDVGGFFTIYANNDILAEVGLEDAIPESYEQFIEYAKKVSDETDYAGFVYAGGLADVYYNWFGRAVEASFLGVETSVDLINRRALMSDPENIKPLKAFEALCQSGAVLDGAIAMTIDDGDMAFAAGDAAYLLGGTFTYGQLQAMGMDTSKVFSFPVPLMEGSVVEGTFEPDAFTLTAMAVPTSSKNVEIAQEFIEFITTDPEGVVLFANGAYILPAGRLDDETIAKLDPAIQAMYSSMADAPSVATQVNNWPDSIGRKLEWEELYKDMQKILTGELTAEQAAANFDANAAAQQAAGQ